MNKKTSTVYIITFYLLNLTNSFAFDVAVTDKVGMNIYGSAECGMTDNRALYATFGYERQLFTCTHAIFGIGGSTKREDKGNIIFRFELAPIYNSIKMVNKKSNDKIKMTAKDIEEYKKKVYPLPIMKYIK